MLTVRPSAAALPAAWIREQVDVRIAARTIEVFHRGRRVAAHQRRYGGRRHGTNPDHMPSAHRRYAEWTPERFRRWARSIGPSTEGLVVAVLANRPHPEQGFRSCLGVLRLFKGLDPARAPRASRPAPSRSARSACWPTISSGPLIWSVPPPSGQASPEAKKRGSEK